MKPQPTHKLYDEDAYCKAFTATVLSCEPTDKGTYAVVLNQTAFFPEGGGQYADTGTLQAFKADCVTPLEAPVSVGDVQEQEGVITHYCDAPLAPWTQVTGVLNWEQRFWRMQHHTGEHLVSGSVHALFGLTNIGFHLGDDDVTCDFNGSLSPEDLAAVEERANRAIWDNVTVLCEYPDPALLPDMEYRSKLDLTENVRIVTIPGYDVCACCAPHVKQTGEIGLIKIVNAEKAHGGTRLHLKCGPAALQDYQIKQTNIMRVVDLTSTPQEETGAAVEALQVQNGNLSHALSQAEVQQATIALSFLEDLAAGADNAPGATNLVVYLPNLETDALRALANGGRTLCTGAFVALTASTEGLKEGVEPKQYRYIITAEHLPLRALSKKMNEALNGRGGGRDEMVQGSLAAPLSKIEAYFQNELQ